MPRPPPVTKARLPDRSITQAVFDDAANHVLDREMDLLAPGPVDRRNDERDVGHGFERAPRFPAERDPADAAGSGGPGGAAPACRPAARRMQRHHAAPPPQGLVLA